MAPVWQCNWWFWFILWWKILLWKMKHMSFLQTYVFISLRQVTGNCQVKQREFVTYKSEQPFFPEWFCLLYYQQQRVRFLTCTSYQSLHFSNSREWEMLTHDCNLYFSDEWASFHTNSGHFCIYFCSVSTLGHFWVLNWKLFIFFLYKSEYNMCICIHIYPEEYWRSKKHQYLNLAFLSTCNGPLYLL